MDIKAFNFLPKDAISIRKEIFMLEQGFKNEFDEIDSTATHYVMYKDGKPIGVCRSFKNSLTGGFTVGRIAVIKEFRGKGLGKQILKAAECEIQKQGGKEVYLHAQVTAEGFYKSCGYHSFGSTDFDEDCPHIWMKKQLC